MAPLKELWSTIGQQVTNRLLNLTVKLKILAKNVHVNGILPYSVLHSASKENLEISKTFFVHE